MSRKHWKTVLDGIDASNQHDITMQSILGMRPLQLPSLSHAAIVTSHPILFQDILENVYDVDVDAENLDGVSDGVDWQDCKLVVDVAIEYRTPETRLNHARMMFVNWKHFVMSQDAVFFWWTMHRHRDGRSIVGLASVCNNDDMISICSFFSLCDE